MKELKEFTIPFIGLKQGEHQFDYELNSTFFSHFEYEEFNDARLKANAKLLKKSNALEFYFSVNGVVNINCDLTNEPFDEEIEGTHHLVINFGEAYQEIDESLIVMPQGSYEINIQQYLYELAILSTPMKKVHPGVKDGTLNSDILKKLEELKPKQLEDNTSSETIDPRWETLKKLLTDK